MQKDDFERHIAIATSCLRDCIGIKEILNLIYAYHFSDCIHCQIRFLQRQHVFLELCFETNEKHLFTFEMSNIPSWCFATRTTHQFKMHAGMYGHKTTMSGKLVPLFKFVPHIKTTTIEAFVELLHGPIIHFHEFIRNLFVFETTTMLTTGGSFNHCVFNQALNQFITFLETQLRHLFVLLNIFPSSQRQPQQPQQQHQLLWKEEEVQRKRRHQLSINPESFRFRLSGQQHYNPMIITERKIPYFILEEEDHQPLLI